MGAITRIALHGPRAVPVAVALRASDRRTVGLTLGMVWLLVGAAISVAAPGTPHPAALGQTRPVASTTASDPVVIDNSLAMPHAPMSARNWPGTSTTMLAMQPVPAFVGVDDPPGLGPAPAADPAVARLLAQLRDQAKGSPTDPRPGPQALVALDFALAQVGRPYVWGATGPDSYDCSGLTWRSYAQAGIALPRVSADQHALGGRPVAITDLLPGDLVFFATAAWDPGAVHHVGMYVGRGLMVDAPHPGTYVRVEPVTAAGYVGAVRVVSEHRAAPSPTRPPRASKTPGRTAAPVDPRQQASPTSTTQASPTSTTQASPNSDPPTPTPTDPPTPTPTDPPTPTPTDPPTPTPTDKPTPSATDPASDPATNPATNPATAPAPDPNTASPSPGTAPPGS